MHPVDLTLNPAAGPGHKIPGHPWYPIKHMQDDDIFESAHFFQPMGPSVPVEFHCAQTSEPFAKCTSCQSPFDAMEQGIGFIEKVMRDGECIIEVALCIECLTKGRCDWSEESLQSIEDHNLENPLQPSGFGACAGCAAEVDIWRDAVTYVGVVDPVFGLLGAPAVICEKCQEQLESVLSVETRREMDEFTESLLPGVPAEGIPSSSLFTL